jgi:hypothetical protein
MRTVALLCLIVLLIACAVAPLHRHNSGQEGACLICHAAERASVVHVNFDAGKPYEMGSQSVLIATSLSSQLDPARSKHGSRAPPTPLLAL